VKALVTMVKFKLAKATEVYNRKTSFIDQLLQRVHKEQFSLLPYKFDLSNSTLKPYNQSIY
jgi:hypothetical protein